MKKIVLINPPYDLNHKREYRVQNYPVGVLCVATALKSAGYNVRLVDCIYEDDYNKIILDECKDALFAGFTVMTNQIACALETASLLRERFPHLPLVWGGVHPTLQPELTAASPMCDIAVSGEADHTAVALARALEAGFGLEKVDGLCFMRNGTVYRTPQALFPKDLDTLPRLDYDFVDIDNYLDLDFDKQYGFFPNTPGSVRRLTLHSARGCPFSCSFCINSLTKDIPNKHRRYRSLSASKVVEDIKYYKKRYDINFISFGDDLFFANASRTREIARILIEEDLGVKWYANVRADFFRKDYIDDQFLNVLWRAGCIRFAIGAESGSARVLEYLDKRLTPRQILHSALAIARHNFVVGYSFMIGLPGERPVDIYRTLALIFMIRSLCPRAYIIGPQIYRPYPGSKLYLDCQERGWKAPETLADWQQNLTLAGHYPLEKMPWIEDKALCQDGLDFVGQLLPQGLGEAWLVRRCPDILAEYQSLGEDLARQSS